MITLQDRPARRDARVSFAIPDDVRKRANKKAAEEGRAMSAILRGWVVEWLDGDILSPSIPKDETVRAQMVFSKPRKRRTAG